MKSLELFAGAGGLALGVADAGFQPRAVYEWDKWACDTINENKVGPNSPVQSWAVKEEDVSNVSFKDYEGSIDLLSGGPPCQPFSMGGLHRAHLDPRDMFPHAIRAVKEVRPRAFLFENVKGLKRQAFSAYFTYIQLQLTYPEIEIKSDEEWAEHLKRLEQHHTAKGTASLSYHVLPPRILNAANFGVPQKRERIFFVGFRSDVGQAWSFPEETHSRTALVWQKWRADDSSYWERHRISSRIMGDELRAIEKNRANKLTHKPALKPWVTVRDALSSLPEPVSSTEEFLNHVFVDGARSYKGHTGSPLDEPAKTLKAGVHGVPGGENMLRNYDGSVRYFTIRECARLQTFPDSYAFHGSWSETMRQLGNAVPVRLAKIIGTSIFEALNKAARPA